MISRLDRSRKKEIDEHRKLGVVPPQEDKDGFYINPHIPSYMADAPWYINDGPGLYHQRLETLQLNLIDKISNETKINKGLIKKNRKRIKWIKGSCENCGALTHNLKECVERPRKFKAKQTNENISLDEYLPQSQNLSWDGKRDRWAGFDINRHQIEIKKWRIMEDIAKQKQEEDLRNRMTKGNAKERKKARKKLNKMQKVVSRLVGIDSDSNSDSDLESDEEDEGMKDSGHVIQKFHAKTRQTVRNLRIREDLPKYLRNLNPNSAFYDPKSRSMRGNPYENGKINLQDDYIGDNFIALSGGVDEFNELEYFADLTRKQHGREKAGNMLINSNPTSTELAFRSHISTKKVRLNELNKDLIKKYGKQYPRSNNKALINETSDQYIEYLPDGRKKQKSKKISKSKYIEDSYQNGHNEIWGSFYDTKNKLWGYGCCFSINYNSHCREELIKNRNKNNYKLGKEKTKRKIGITPKPKEFKNKKKKTLMSGYTVVKGIVAITKNEREEL